MAANRIIARSPDASAPRHAIDLAVDSMIHFHTFRAHHEAAHQRTLFPIVEHTTKPATPRRAAMALFRPLLSHRAALLSVLIATLFRASPNLTQAIVPDYLFWNSSTQWQR